MQGALGSAIILSATVKAFTTVTESPLMGKIGVVTNGPMFFKFFPKI